MLSNILHIIWTLNQIQNLSAKLKKKLSAVNREFEPYHFVLSFDYAATSAEQFVYGCYFHLFVLATGSLAIFTTGARGQAF